MLVNKQSALGATIKVFLVLYHSAPLSMAEYDPHLSNHLSQPSSKRDMVESNSTNYYAVRCAYDRQCDNDYGYICRDGGCTCKFGRSDPLDGFKCKVQVKLGDFCMELPKRKRNSKESVYVRRKCPRNAECDDASSGICVCNPFFERKGDICIPKVMIAGSKTCKAHSECLTQRGQLCHDNNCIECAAGRFRHFRPNAKWTVAMPECNCFTKLEQNDTSSSHKTRHRKTGIKGSCALPVDSGDHCTVSDNCVSPHTPHHVCEDGICQCPPGSKEVRLPTMPSNSFSVECIVPINSQCGSDSECHGPTAFCDKRLEVTVCKCRDGFQLIAGGPKDQYHCISRYYEEVCGRFFPQSETHREHLRKQGLTCVKGLYECRRPREMYWDDERGKCVSLVGARCDGDLSDLLSCAGTSRCWEYSGLGEYRCQCPFSHENNNQKPLSNSRIYEPSRNRRTCIESRAL